MSWKNLLPASCTSGQYTYNEGRETGGAPHVPPGTCAAHPLGSIRAEWAAVESPRGGSRRLSPRLTAVRRVFPICRPGGVLHAATGSFRQPAEKGGPMIG